MRRVPRLPVLVPLLSAFLALTGCGTINRLTRPLTQAAATLFTAATIADLQLIGVKTGPLVPVQADPAFNRANGAQPELTPLLGEGPPVGVLLPITQVGETTPWWIFCPAGELQKRCEEIPSNARVTFTGRPLGRGAVLLPTRLTWSVQ